MQNTDSPFIGFVCRLLSELTVTARPSEARYPAGRCRSGVRGTGQFGSIYVYPQAM
jgi:hypothetical protein